MQKMLSLFRAQKNQKKLPTILQKVGICLNLVSEALCNRRIFQRYELKGEQIRDIGKIQDVSILWYNNNGNTI